ncbi:like AUXIN RESISTANT 2 [Actinidia rufa]|uniref:Like AUXIN RESISTANT 2 n=1 Tax=Actinidia rufa TaxID=165716 RepID=A0A7J0F8S6_9ERIC|nr:like AUXIN RESISTANT 2 [Actinidia rufa]
MASEKVVETVLVGNYVEMETEGKPKDVKTRISNLFWHGGSVYDAWFSCASNQVAQVLLTLPYSFSQLGMVSGVLFQIFYGLMGSWTAYLISTLYVEYRTRKEREKVDFRNHVIQWFEVLDGLLGKHWRNVGLAFNCTFLLFGSVIQLIACASNIYYINDNLDKRTWTYIFGACCATTVFIPSFRNYRIWSFLGLIMTTYTAWYLTIASLLHGQVGHFIIHVIWDSYLYTFITFGFACTPLYFVWEKAIGMHECKSLCKRAAARLPVVVPIWFLAIIFPFFGPINSTVGSLLVSFTVYIIPALAHMITFKSAASRENAVEQPPNFLGRWAGAYTINVFVVVWVFIVGFGFGGWASMTNFIHQIDTFGLFTKCYQCPPPQLPPPAANLNFTTIAPSPAAFQHRFHRP